MAKYYTKKSNNQYDINSKKTSVKQDKYSTKSETPARKSNAGWIIFLIIVFASVYFAMKYFVFK